MKPIEKAVDLMQGAECEFIIHIGEQYACEATMPNRDTLLSLNKLMKRPDIKDILFDEYCNFKDKGVCEIYGIMCGREDEL